MNTFQISLTIAGSIIIRCEIWGGKMFIRDGFSSKVITKPSKTNKKKTVKTEINVDTKTINFGQSNTTIEE